MTAPRIAILSEGDANDPVKPAYSGTSRSIARVLTERGLRVTTVDCDVHGARRAFLAARSVHTDRRTWKAQYHFSAAAFRARSAAARAAMRDQPPADVLMMTTATFAPPRRTGEPYALFSDWNCALAIRFADVPGSPIPFLSAAEVAAINAREREIYEGASVIFTLSAALRGSFISDYGIAPERVIAVGAGPNFDLSDIPGDRPVRPADRAPTILFVGKEFERKGGLVLLDAFRTVRATLPTARLLILGTTDVPGTHEGVEVVGFLRKSVPAEWARFAELHQTADVFCLPTLYDPFPTVVREAMFFGLPCVTSDVWAMPEMVEDRVTGLVVPVNDTEALAAALLDVLQHPERAQAMGTAGRQRAERLFAWPPIGERMEDGLRRLALG